MLSVAEKVNFNKNKKEANKDAPPSTYTFWETKLVLQLIEEFQIKNKTEMSWNSRKKKEAFFLKSSLSIFFYILS